MNFFIKLEDQQLFFVDFITAFVDHFSSGMQKCFHLALLLTLP